MKFEFSIAEIPVAFTTLNADEEDGAATQPPLTSLMRRLYPPVSAVADNVNEILSVFPLALTTVIGEIIDPFELFIIIIVVPETVIHPLEQLHEVLVVENFAPETPVPPVMVNVGVVP